MPRPARALLLAALAALPAGAMLLPVHSLPVDTGAGPEPYHIWPYVTADLAALALLHPDHAAWTSIGRSVGGLDLWMLEIADFDSLDGTEPVVVLDGGHHGNEQLGIEALYAIALHLLNDYDANASVRAIVDNTRLFLVPSVNPDGTMADTRKNLHQVDLNRNYPFHWGEPGCSHNLLSFTYCGPRAASEPEVQAMVALLQRLDPDLYLSAHTGVTLLLSPWGYTTSPPPDKAFYDGVNARFEQRFGIDAGQASTTLYVASGTSKDYAYGALGIPSWTFEVDDEQFAPLSIEDIERRLAPVLAAYYWFLDHAGNLGAVVSVGEPSAEPLGGGAFRVTYPLTNAGFGPARVEASLGAAGSLAAVAPSVVVEVPPEGGASAAFTVQALADGPGTLELTASYAKTEHLGKTVLRERATAANVSGGAIALG